MVFNLVNAISHLIRIFQPIIENDQPVKQLLNRRINGWHSLPDSLVSYQLIPIQNRPFGLRRTE